MRIEKDFFVDINFSFVRFWALKEEEFHDGFQLFSRFNPEAVNDNVSSHMIADCFCVSWVKARASR